MKFLFHTGSIKSCDPTMSHWLKIISFYSILVRLKDSGIEKWRVNVDISFYSILVRLKAEPIVVASETIDNVSIPYWFD